MPDNPVTLFYLVLGGVLGANMLTVVFVHALIAYSKREAFDAPRGKYLAPMLLPFGFLGLAVLIMATAQ